MFDIFHALSQQTNKDFNVWISDHSKSDKVLEACKEYADLFEINYIKNTKKYGNISANTNHALQHADGDILKVLFSDDFILTCNLVAELDKAFLMRSSGQSQDMLTQLMMVRHITIQRFHVIMIDYWRV